MRPALTGRGGLLGAGLQMKPDHPEYEAHRVAFLRIYEGRLDRDSRLFDGVLAVVQKSAAKPDWSQWVSGLHIRLDTARRVQYRLLSSDRE